MRYCLAKREEKQLDEAYRIYVTEALRAISESSARSSGGGYVTTRYADIVKPKKPETRSGEEIISHMKAVLRKHAEKEVQEDGLI